MGRRGSARGARAKGNQGFGRSINTCFSISTCCFIVVVVVVIIMLIRLEPVEVQPCCRPLRAAQFLLLSVVSILSWDHHHHRHQYYHHHHHVHHKYQHYHNVTFYSDTRFSLEYQSSQALLPTPSGPERKVRMR